mmetsp:Transcript_12832/g.10960  ORF Transcript_12832/g.10960 Transcript_12832/m.10960 type:complete len:145 (+) Transcript_12832:55-489(+)
MGDRNKGSAFPWVYGIASLGLSGFFVYKELQYRTKCKDLEGYKKIVDDPYKIEIQSAKYTRIVSQSEEDTKLILDGKPLPSIDDTSRFAQACNGKTKCSVPNIAEKYTMRKLGQRLEVDFVCKHKDLKEQFGVKKYVVSDPEGQ